MRTPPHHGSILQEKLDVLLTTAAFDQPIVLLFLDDGVFQLKKTQQPEKQVLKDTACILNAVEMYGVKSLFIEVEAMQERGLKQSDFTSPLKAINRKEINNFMKQFDIIASG